MPFWANTYIARSGGYDYIPEGQRRASKIGVIGDLSADVGILYVKVNWAKAGGGQRVNIFKKEKHCISFAPNPTIRPAR